MSQALSSKFISPNFVGNYPRRNALLDGMQRIAKLALAVTVPLLIAGWAAFRPELLFVDQKVSETAPVVFGRMPQTVAKGEFQSYAHDTEGKAELLNVDGRGYVRLSGFKTSNGPDVHVYLVKGGDASEQGVKNAGFLDLGRIKGNEGDQNYELPVGSKLDDYRGVAIWCARFNVNFGGADLRS